MEHLHHLLITAFVFTIAFLPGIQPAFADDMRNNIQVAVRPSDDALVDAESTPSAAEGTFADVAPTPRASDGMRALATDEDEDMHALAWADNVFRLAGNSALDTMSTIVEEGRFAKGGTVVLASLEGYWDALTAAGIAGLEGAPVVMTGRDSLSAQASAQIKRLEPKKIIICGGTYWIPDKVKNQAASAAGVSTSAVTRLAGSNAVVTAEKIAKRGKGRWSTTAIVTTVGTFQDALAAAPVSYAKAMPIFLAQFDFAKQRGSLTQSTIKAMKNVGIKKCYIAGGKYWLPDQVTKDLKAAGITVIDQLQGKTAVETSVEIAKMATGKLGMYDDNLGLADVNQHYDALAGAAFCGKRNSVLLLVKDVKSSCLSSYTKGRAKSITTAYVFGGSSSVSENVKETLDSQVASARTQNPLHYALDARNFGPNRKLQGNVMLYCIFVEQGSNTWSEDEMKEMYAGLWKDTAYIEKQAASYGVDVKFSSMYEKVSVPAGEDDWYGYLMDNRYNNPAHDLLEVQGYFEKLYCVDSMPFLFYFNVDGRCFCYQSTRSSGWMNELAVYYPSTMSEDRSIAHELYHLYGAIDLYYPKVVKEAAQKRFSKSAMIGGCRDIDELTAYLIGWTDAPEKNAAAFLNDIKNVTQADVDAEYGY